jgi:formylglycine-generating enzyme required for sulfatase activity
MMAKRDEYGMYKNVCVNGVTFKMFLVSGRVCFLMGSPENEPQRFDDETQHRVIISRDFWLAETTCTQELWNAVIGNNPSYFKGENLPVETVSWNDCQKFITGINKINTGFKFRLPTEAEWEYACRAGTNTPFSFGNNITTDQVNYDGNYPYNGSQKGEYRNKTVSVKSLPPNPWGFYEMHGNVWEWCQDYYNKYKSSNVLRGGSWDNPAKYCRCAYRSRLTPGNRDGSLGFRLAGDCVNCDAVLLEI